MITTITTIMMTMTTTTITTTVPATNEDHEGGELCACAAAEEAHPFTIDCSNSAALASALETLEGCTQSEEGCHDYVDTLVS